MDFKEWFLDEARFKGFQRQFKMNNPDMPAYVQKDLYNTRVAHTLGKTIDARSSLPDSPTPNPSDILNKTSFGGKSWNKKAIILQSNGRKGVTPKDFSSRTQDYFLNRRFGFREEKQVRNDAQRTLNQKQILGNKAEGTNEPIIVRQVSDGYELLEGWHRTMVLLLKGAPPEQLQIVQGGYLHDINFDLWKPVLINAFIGKDKNVIDAGTGSYQYDSDGTGDYQYSGLN